jgi:dihydrofolate reductase
MRKVMVVNNLSLDGVMQAPGRADEDTRDGFTHGGWATAYNDAVKGQAMAKDMSRGSDLLFGRRTYEDFYKVWPHRKDNPFTAVLDNTPKYVVSNTLSEPLPWQNSTLLRGDAGATVAKLKAEPGRDLTVLGSGVLVQSLLRHNLVDQFTLLIHPLLLGTGHRLFPADGALAKFELQSHVTTTVGVIIATYTITS